MCFDSGLKSPRSESWNALGLLMLVDRRQVGRCYEHKPTELTVEPVPLDGYLSHAEIPQKITRGLSNEIVKRLDLKQESS